MGGHLVDRYDREFMKLKIFAPSLVDTQQKMTEELVLDLNLEIYHTIEAIHPKTYDEALRTTMALKKPRDEVRQD